MVEPGSALSLHSTCNDGSLEGTVFDRWRAQHSACWSRSYSQWTPTHQELIRPTWSELSYSKPLAAVEGLADSPPRSFHQTRQLHPQTLAPGPVPERPLLEEMGTWVPDFVIGAPEMVVSCSQCTDWRYCPYSWPERSQRFVAIGQDCGDIPGQQWLC